MLTNFFPITVMRNSFSAKKKIIFFLSSQKLDEEAAADGFVVGSLHENILDERVATTTNKKPENVLLRSGTNFFLLFARRKWVPLFFSYVWPDEVKKSWENATVN